MNDIEKYIKDEKKFSYALKRWGIEEILNRFNRKVDNFMKSFKFDLDDYCGSFLMSRLAIENFKDAELFTDSQLRLIDQLDTKILKNTVQVRENIYTLTAYKKEFYDEDKYWFLYRIPLEALGRLKLKDYLTCVQPKNSSGMSNS